MNTQNKENEEKYYGNSLAKFILIHAFFTLERVGLYLRRLAGIRWDRRPRTGWSAVVRTETETNINTLSGYFNISPYWFIVLLLESVKLMSGWHWRMTLMCRWCCPSAQNSVVIVITANSFFFSIFILVVIFMAKWKWAETEAQKVNKDKKWINIRGIENARKIHEIIHMNSTYRVLSHIFLPVMLHK